MTSSTGFSPSVYDAESALLDLADTYLQPGTYSTLKSGFLGYMTGSMARVAAEGVHHRNILYSENFLNTASMPRSIYNFAKIYDYPVGLAAPSSCRVLIGFYLDEIISTLGSNIGVLSIPRSQPVYLGGTPFVIAGAINLSILSGGAVAAEYLLDQMDFTTINQTSYIRTYVTPQVVDTAGTVRTVVYLEATIHQAVSRANQFTVVSSSILETSFYTINVPTGEQLATFRVLYQGPSDAAFREITTIFNETTTPTTPEYCFYNFNTGNELEIYFSPLPGSFIPAYNSLLRIEYLTTTGAAGNFDYTGTPVLPYTVASVVTLVEMVTRPLGGYDSETLMEVKRGILLKILERSNIIIESDLENYLTGAVDRTQVNNSQITFIKRRDDIQTRLFAAYLMIRNSAGRIVPTNTAPLDFEAADLESRGWSLRPGTLVVYDRRNALYRLMAPGEYPDQMVSDPNSFVYCIPFLMQFQVRPIPRLVYYQNQANIDAPLISLPGAIVTADSFIASSVTVKRNSAFEDSYQIDLSVSSNLDAAGLDSKCLVRVRFLDKSGAPLGYVEAFHLANTNVFRATITTADQFDTNGLMLFVDSLWSDATDTLIPNAPLPQAVTIRLELYYNNQDPSGATSYVDRNNNRYHLAYVFQTVNTLSLYTSLEQVMSSSMYVTTTGTFHCDNVPLIGASFFLNPRIGMEAISIIQKYHDAIFAIFNLLQNNTSVDVKLYNTYGPSMLFNLDRVNLSMVLEVSPQLAPSDILRTAVKEGTSTFIQSCNTNTLSRFSISNLTTYLETTIPDVAFVRFVSLNGVAAQNAQQIFTAAAIDINNKLIPEFINSSTILLSNLNQDPYTPDVTVTFI